MPAPLLFQPFALKSVTARNRIVLSPMCQYRSVDGSPSDWHVASLSRYAIGGAGIVFCEETAIEARGRKTHDCAGLYRDEHVPEYRRITDMLRQLGAVPAMQLGHAGGKASAHGPNTGRAALQPADADRGLPPWQTISASPVPAEPDYPLPHEMTQRDIDAVIAAWVLAARRTLEAGFDILEIHGAHGYLIQQFLSPVINRRTDGYGGSRNARMRFAIEVTQAVRQAWPADRPLFFRVSSVDGKGGIWDIEDSVALAAELRLCGVDVIDCSSGGLLGSSDMPAVPRVPSYHVPYARRIKEATGMMTMAPGLITRATQAEALLQEGQVDLIGMARELMYCADWPVHAARELDVDGYLDLFPADFTSRLRQRDEHRAMAYNRA